MTIAIRNLFALATALFFTTAATADLMNDVVAYFTEGAPVRGDEEIEVIWRDVRWRFASLEHRVLFEADPERYAPRYGGFCAGGLALGRTSPIDPEAFVIVDGKLYLNFDKSTAEEVRANPETILPKADANWERINSGN